MANRFKQGFQKREESSARDEVQKPVTVQEPVKKETVPSPTASSKPKSATKKPAPTKTTKTKEKEPILFPSKKETKSKRLNLLFKPSDVAKWQKEAEKQGVTLTVFIETVVNNFCDNPK